MGVQSVIGKCALASDVGQNAFHKMANITATRQTIRAIQNRTVSHGFWSMFFSTGIPSRRPVAMPPKCATIPTSLDMASDAYLLQIATPVSTNAVINTKPVISHLLNVSYLLKIVDILRCIRYTPDVLDILQCIRYTPMYQIYSDVLDILWMYQIYSDVLDILRCIRYTPVYQIYSDVLDILWMYQIYSDVLDILRCIRSTLTGQVVYRLPYIPIRRITASLTGALSKNLIGLFFSQSTCISSQFYRQNNLFLIILIQLSQDHYHIFLLITTTAASTPLLYY